MRRQAPRRHQKGASLLSELLTTLDTPCPKPAAALGYRRELIALDARARRCGAAWAPHLAACRSTIRTAISRTDRRRLAVVLGAGPLNDVPVAMLAAAFERVMLVDVLHLRATRTAVAAHATVDLVSSDVTGMIDTVHGLPARRKKGETLMLPRAPDMVLPVPPQDIDLLVSLNLLSQLPVPLWHYLDDKIRGIDETVLDRFAATVIEAHLTGLRDLPGTVCLIADLERQYVDRAGRIIDREDALYGCQLPPDATAGWRGWLWDVAPIGELDRRWSLRRVVRATPAL